ncbi:MAG: ABC transporter permease [Thermomicrobiales bacterium]|nr:MAG: ABC transporter permease [Thermomicrobiales bacterium]
MRRRDPLLPNAGIIARREYRDRTRSPLFIVSTILLAVLAMMVAIAPIGVRLIDRQSVSRLVVISSDAELGTRALAVAESLLNSPPAGVDLATWQRPYQLEIGSDPETTEALLSRGLVAGIMLVERQANGGVDVRLRTAEGPTSARSQILSVAAFGVGVLDWSSRVPSGALAPFVTPTYTVESINTATDGGAPLDIRQAASRYLLGIVFVILLLISIIIYGMWVATGVASEKSSRVMELMISAASPRQMLAGKVVGIGSAGLTQYAMIALPALILLAFQDRIASALLGPDWISGAPLGGLTAGLLLGYGLFFLLGFALFALIYAAMGSFVSRPDDLQTLSLPLSLVAMAGYLIAIVALGGGSGTIVTLASLLPPFSPFVMLARVMVSAVEPWELVLSIGLLIAAIGVVAVIATRMYAAGVLLYGQRPGLRAFVTAARRA